MSALAPLFALLFLGLMGWLLLRLIGGPEGPETFNPNSCSSCSSKQGGDAASARTAGTEVSDDETTLKRFPVASGQHRLGLPR